MGAIGGLMSLSARASDMEDRMTHLETGHAKMEYHQQSVDSKVSEQLSDIRAAVARIEGKLQIQH